jgi:hypothetical protein
VIHERVERRRDVSAGLKGRRRPPKSTVRPQLRSAAAPSRLPSCAGQGGLAAGPRRPPYMRNALALSIDFRDCQASAGSYQGQGRLLEKFQQEPVVEVAHKERSRSRGTARKPPGLAHAAKPALQPDTGGVAPHGHAPPPPATMQERM